MRVLMTYIGTNGGMAPGHDDDQEVSSAAGQLAQLGVRVTVAAGGAMRGDRALNADLRRDILAPLLRVMPVARIWQMPLTAVMQLNLSLLATLMAGWRRGDRYDLVHCFGWKAGLASGLLAEAANWPLVLSVKDILADRSSWLPDPVAAYSRCVLGWLLRRCQRLLCPDVYTREKLRDLFLVGEDKLAVIPPRWSRSDVIACTDRDDPARRNILYVGPLDLTRGLRRLLQACAVLRDGKICRPRVLLCGPMGTDDHLAIRSLVRNFHLAGQVFFQPPAVSARSWDRLLWSTDMLILPDPVEFIGNVVLRAVEMGVPILVARGGAMTGLSSNEQTVLTFSHQNSRELGKLMAGLLTSSPPRYGTLPGETNTTEHRQPMGAGLLDLYRSLCPIDARQQRKGGEICDLPVTSS